MATTNGIGAADPASLAAALVAPLEQALLAAERLLGALESLTSDRAGAATFLAPGRALAGWGSALPGRAAASDEARAPLEPPATWPACGATAPAMPVATPPGLSRREAEVLRLLAAGHSNRRIAQALFLSPRTVQRHVANVYLKTGAHCRVEAAAYAIRHGLG